MTFSELTEKWMVIGTANKSKKNKSSKKGRVLTGEKGLGRLGLDRLCVRTRVQTLSRESQTAYELDIDWKKYEGVEERIETIQHQIYEISNIEADPVNGTPVEFRSGTRLILEGLKDDWSPEALSELRGELALLLSPFQAANDFNILFDTGLIEDPNSGSIAPPDFFLDAAYWKLKATLSADGIVEARMTSGRHDVEYHFKPEPWVEAIKGLGEKPLCGPISFELYYFPRKEAGWGEQTLTKGQISEFLNLNQGVRIYRDGFRVKPYGQPSGEGDWLSLAYRRVQNPEGVRQGTWRVGPNQVIGAVFISRETNPTLSDQTNREGLLDGPAFSHLRAFAFKSIRWFEEKNTEFERARLPLISDSIEKSAEAALRASDEASKSLSEISDKLKSKIEGQSGHTGHPNPDDDITKLLKTAQDQVEISKASAEDFARSAKEIQAEVANQKDTLANLASLGILAASFGHETSNWAGNVVKNSEFINEVVEANALLIDAGAVHDVREALQILGTESKKIRKFAKFSLGNITREKRKKTLVDLKKVVDYVFDSFEEILEKERKIKIIRDQVPEGECLILGYETDWESILINLITNSVWAMEDLTPERRIIRVGIARSSDHYSLSFDDSGFGLEAGTEDLIFNPTFTTRKNRRGEETGTGLGLTIVRAFVTENSRGTITARVRGELGGASFVLRVPVASQD